MMRHWIALLLWMALIWFLSSIPDLRSGFPTLWDLILRKLGHMIEFGVLARLAYRVRPNRAWAGTFSLFYAIADELHQHFVPGRNGAALDVLVDAAGIAISLFVITLPPRRSSRTRPVRARQNTPGFSDQA